MKFSELEDGEKRLESFKRELLAELELERAKRRNEEASKWLERMPWIVVAAMGWLFFFLSMGVHH